MRQQFDPEKYFLFFALVNVDAPFKEKHGEANKIWQRLANNLNLSLNINKNAIK
jgi:hypothetical protein